MNEDVYFDTSSAIAFIPKEKSVEIIRRHGADKVFFGTDYPITTNDRELERFMELPLTDDERELILYKNAEKFLDLK